MEPKESERLYALTRNWRMNTVFLEPPEIVIGQPQIMDTVFSTAKKDMQIENSSDQREEEDKTIFKILNTVNIEGIVETDQIKTALLTSTANKTKYKNDDSGDTNIIIVNIFPDELTLNDSYQKKNLKRLLINKKEKDDRFKPKTLKDYYSSNSTIELLHMTPSKSCPINYQSPWPLTTQKTNINTITVDNDMSHQITRLQKVNIPNSRSSTYNHHIVPAMQLVPTTSSVVVTVDTGSNNPSLDIYSEETEKHFSTTVSRIDKQIINMIPDTPSYCSQINNILVNASEFNNQITKANRTISTIIPKPIIKFNTLKKSSVKLHIKHHKSEFSNFLSEANKTLSTNFETFAKTITEYENQNNSVITSKSKYTTTSKKIKVVQPRVRKPKGNKSMIYPEPFDTFPSNVTEDKNQENSAIAPKFEFTTTTKKLKLGRSRALKPKSTINLSGTSNISSFYPPSIIYPEPIDTFPSNMTGDKNQENTATAPNSEFTTTNKKLKLGRSKALKPKSTITLSKTSNISSPYQQSMIYPEPIDTFPSNMTGDKNQENTATAPNSEFTTTPKKLKLGRSKALKPKSTITLSKTSNISSSYSQSMIYPQPIDTFPSNMTGDKNQENSVIVPKSEFTTTTKKLKIGRSRAVKPKSTITLSETSNISSSYPQSIIYPEPIDTFLSNMTGEKNQENSATAPNSEFTTTPKKLKLGRSKALKPKSTITLSKTSNISSSYSQSMIYPQPIDTFPSNMTGDKNQENTAVAPKSEFTTTPKKLKLGRSKALKPKSTITSSETNNISSSYPQSIIYPEPIDTFPSNLTGDKIQDNSAIAPKSEFTTTTKKLKVGRPRGQKTNTSYHEVKNKNSSRLMPRVERNPPSTENEHMAFTKYYQMFLNIQNQIIKKHNNLFPVPPIPPSGFKDYIMNKHTYILAGDSNRKLEYTPRVPQTNLHDQLKTLFVEQEKNRQKLRAQHTVEKEKFILCVEQEILRVHGKIARELANQPLPFSVCTLLLDKELVNKSISSKKVEDNDELVRPENDGSIYISWLQELDEKWEKSKVDMIRRHRNEAEGLYNIQKMDWEWKLMELKMDSYSEHPNIENEHVSIVEVSEDFVVYQT